MYSSIDKAIHTQSVVLGTSIVISISLFGITELANFQGENF